MSLMVLYSRAQLLIASLVSPILGGALVIFNLLRIGRWRPAALLGVAVVVPLLLLGHPIESVWSVLFLALTALFWPYTLTILFSPPLHWDWLAEAAVWLTAAPIAALGFEAAFAVNRSKPAPAIGKLVGLWLCVGLLAVAVFTVVVGALIMMASG